MDESHEWRKERDPETKTAVFRFSFGWPSSMSEEMDVTVIQVAQFEERSVSKYPRALYYILPNELGERFCFLGLWLLSNQYLKGAFGMDEGRARLAAYIVGMLVFGFPLIGAAISDCFLGKYHTIIGFSCLYMVGNVLMTVTAIPGVAGEFGSYPAWAFLVPASLIAVGSGGLKPCVAPHGADQFEPNQDVEGFYMAFYFCINIGAIFVHLTLPFLSNTLCFGQRCYFVAFLVPTAMFMLALAVFILGSRHYCRVPPCGEFLPLKALLACITAGLAYLKSSKESRASAPHWLHLASNKFSVEFLDEVRQILEVIKMFIPITVLWMLDLQTTVEWQNQFEMMNHNLLGFSVPTEASSFLGPVLVAALAPLLSWGVFPFLERRNFPITTTGRMRLGFLLIILSFVMSTSLQYYVLAHNQSQVKFNNTAIACPDCVSGFWQLPQLVTNALGDVLISPASQYMTYAKVSPRFKSQSNAIFLFTYSIASFAVIALDLLLPKVTDVNRMWFYISLTSLFLAIFLFQSRSSKIHLATP